jgi:hypothetical protein
MTAAAVALAALAGCDPTARTASSGGEGPTIDRRSREHESCARSADCAGDLRCFDGVCRRTRLSVLGDLHAALGDRELTAGRANAAAEAYGAALSRYEQEKLEPPASLLCSHGSALAAEAGADAARLERAARLLHRCLGGAPAGSFLRQRALGELAGLMAHGLEPDLLARRDPADLYLTRQATAPAAAPDVAPDSVEVQVVLDSRSRAGSLRKLTAFLEKSADLRTALTACWKAYFDRTRKDTLAVAVPLQYGSAWDDDETYLSSWIKLGEAPAPADPPAAEATTCARQAIGPLVEAEGKKLREETRWQAVANFTVAPGKQP